MRSETVVPGQADARAARGAAPAAETGATEAHARGQVMAEFVASCEERRGQLGLSYAALARRMGVSRAYVSRMMQGRENSTVGSLVRLAAALEGEVGLRLRHRGSKGGHLPALRTTRGLIVRRMGRMTRSR